ncbi:hypothetical protein niasHT_005107 [Heterodera trifolii]|uniref:Effector protein n=1 Tax=Heterodera trifolii TaxID=157864 RepID=A0ABD2M7A8_9BILA
MLLVFLLLFSSVFTEKKCLTPTELFNSLSVGMSSSPVVSNDDQLGSTSSSDAHKICRASKCHWPMRKCCSNGLAKSRSKLSLRTTLLPDITHALRKRHGKSIFVHWIAKKQLKAKYVFVGEAFQNLGNKKSDFLKMLFAFAALLSAEIGQQSFKESSFTRIFLKAYECVANKKISTTENEKGKYNLYMLEQNGFQYEEICSEKNALLAKNGLNHRKHWPKTQFKYSPNWCTNLLILRLEKLGTKNDLKENPQRKRY